MSERLTRSARTLPRPDADLGYLFRLAHQRFRVLLDSELEDLGLSAQEYGVLSVFESPTPEQVLRDRDRPAA